MTTQSLASLFGPVLLRDRASEKDSDLLAQAAGHDGGDADSMKHASLKAASRATEAFQLNYKVSLLLLYMLKVFFFFFFLFCFVFYFVL